jgi:error-prone DNA polymerase
VIQWDKDDLDAVGMIKVDVLGLGMLSAIRRSFELIEGFTRVGAGRWRACRPRTRRSTT